MTYRVYCDDLMMGTFDELTRGPDGTAFGVLKPSQEFARFRTLIEQYETQRNESVGGRISSTDVGDAFHALRFRVRHTESPRDENAVVSVWSTPGFGFVHVNLAFRGARD